MDIKPLRYFIAVAETGHVGRAAQRLNITQPPLSRQIALLEEELGTALFSRHPKGVSLTAAGEQFYRDSKTILQSVSKAAERARATGAGKSGSLSVGFMMHAAYNIVPELARQFMSRYPAVSFHIQEVIPFELINGVTSAQFDAAIMLKPATSRGLEMLSLRTEALCLAVHKHHRLAVAKKVCAEDLVDEKFIVTPHNVAPELRNTIEQYCAGANFVPRVVLETQLQQTIVSLVASEVGIALVPEPLKQVCPPDVVLLPLKKAPVMEYVLVWQQANSNPALARFIECASESP